MARNFNYKITKWISLAKTSKPSTPIAKLVEIGKSQNQIKKKIYIYIYIS